MLRIRSFVSSSTLSSISLDLYEEEFDAKIQSAGASFWSKAKVSIFSGRLSGTASNTIQAPLTAGSRSATAWMTPGVFPVNSAYC